MIVAIDKDKKIHKNIGGNAFSKKANEEIVNFETPGQFIMKFSIDQNKSLKDLIDTYIDLLGIKNLSLDICFACYGDEIQSDPKKIIKDYIKGSICVIDFEDKILEKINNY